MKPLNLAKARILVTNDDGIHAPGLEALVEIASALSSDIWIVAPEVNQSGAGHSLSLSRPIRCREVTLWPVLVMCAAPFDRGIPAGCVASPSNTAGILGRRALPPGRLGRNPLHT